MIKTLNRWIAISVLLTLFPFYGSLFAQGLDDLDSLSDTSAQTETEDTIELSDDTKLSDNMDGLSEEEGYETESSDSELSVSFGGYLKVLTYGSRAAYSDDTWKVLQVLAAQPGVEVPAEQDSSKLSDVGSRIQLKMEGFLSDKARAFTAVNLDFNDVSETDTNTGQASTGSSQGNIRLVESFIEIFQGNTTWKAGSQIISWGFLEGIETPTDRVNARDFSYKSTEYEDTKLASNALQFSQRFWDQRLDIIYIPSGKTTVMPEYSNFLYTGSDNRPAQTPSEAKFAYRFGGTLGDLDYALSYVNEFDTLPDFQVNPVTNKLDKTYHRVQSPGLDLQYNFGSGLAKLAYVEYQTEDEEGDDPFIKNSWKKYMIGGEMIFSGQILNLYAGQIIIKDWQDYSKSGLQFYPNLILSQLREQTDFASGHLILNFLPGDALKFTLMAAGYWDKDGKPVQSVAKLTSAYKVTNGLDFLVSPGYINVAENSFYDVQAELKYAF